MAKIHSTVILVAVFVLGIAAGIGAALWTGPALRARLHKPQPFEKALNLTPTQTEEFHAILKETQDEGQRIRNQFAPQYAHLQEEYQQVRQQERDLYLPIRTQERQKLRAALNPDQQKKFDAWTAQYDAAHSQQHSGHSMGRGGNGRGPNGRGPNGPGGPPPGGGSHHFPLL